MKPFALIDDYVVVLFHVYCNYPGIMTLYSQLMIYAYARAYTMSCVVMISHDRSHYAYA